MFNKIMDDVEDILLNHKDRKLLKYIEENGLHIKDDRVNSSEFKAIDSYGMLLTYEDKRFPNENVDEDSHLKYNAYKTCPDVEKYWRYFRSHRKNRIISFLGKIVLGVIGGCAGGLVALLLPQH